MLTDAHVDNAAYRLDFEELGGAPTPFLAHVKTNGGDLVLVKRIENDRYYLSSDKWDGHKVSAAEFKKMYNGIVLSAEPSDRPASAVTAPTVLKQLKTPALCAEAILILTAALVFHSGYIHAISWQSALLTLFKTAGLITSVLLLIQSVDSNNPLVQVLCQTQGKTDCNAILSSKAAKAFWGFSWSEIGFFYFAGTWLLLLFGDNLPAVRQTIALLNFISLPYTFYSIYYQWRVGKQWCVLCCTVQALFWLEFVAILFIYPTFGTGWADITALSTIFIYLLTPAILWLILKPMFLKLQQLQPLKQQLRKFKYNAELFNKMLAEQPKYELPNESWSIVLGNAAAENIITMISNPYCPPCSKAHANLDTLLNERANIQARIIFIANNDERDRNTPITRHLMALNDVADRQTVKQALHDWYEQRQKNYEAWAKMYPVELNANGFYKIDLQREWCEMAGVTATPTLLLNGYRLPDLYQLTDLKYMPE